MRVLVCGGRAFNDLGAVWGQLDATHALEGPITCLIHGGANGADALGASWAFYNKIEVRPFQADWKRYGASAGPRRNKEMLIVGKPDLVLAFPGGSGTANMVKITRRAGIEVREIAP